MKRRLLSKPFIIGIVVVLIAAGAGAFLLTRGDPASVSYRTGVATLGTVTQTVSLSGNLAPDGETDLDFEGAGKVTGRQRATRTDRHCRRGARHPGSDHGR